MTHPKPDKETETQTETIKKKHTEFCDCKICFKKKQKELDEIGKGRESINVIGIGI